VNTRDPAALGQVELRAGGHRSPEEGLCATEAVAWLAGESHSAEPVCLSPALGRFLRGLNDMLDPVRRQQLKPLLPRCIGTADDAKDDRRGWVATNWLIHTGAPLWLEDAGNHNVATALRDQPAIRSQEELEAARPTLLRARDEAMAERVAARDKLLIAHADREPGVSDDPALIDPAAHAAPIYAAAHATAELFAHAGSEAAVDAVAYLPADAVMYATKQVSMFLSKVSGYNPEGGVEQSLSSTRDGLYGSVIDLFEQLIDPPAA
jgi:hypothetical protein